MYNRPTDLILNYRKWRRYLVILVLMIFALTACKGGAVIGNEFNLGGIWEVELDEGLADWDTASLVASEQWAGFQLANQSAIETEFTPVVQGEGNRQDDIQVSIRSMVEEDEIIALVGATTNEASMRSASLANFFNLPILIPGADGPLLFPENNFWAYRLGAPSSAYSSYLFKDLLGDPTRENRVDPAEIKIAILYEQNTFGESAAVAAATEAMDQLVVIEVYANFHPTTPDPTDIGEMVRMVFDERVDLAYLISNQPETAGMLVQAFNAQMLEGESLPVMIGQGNGFASQEFLSSDQAEEVIVMRQRIVEDNCPSEIETIAEAQTYAALILLDNAVQDAKRKGLSSLDTSFLDFLRPNSTTRPIVKFREIVRDVLKETNQEVPCLGLVTFDNSGQNKNLKFDFLVTDNNKNEILPIDELLLMVKERVRN